jgi:hypothetical protein
MTDEYHRERKRTFSDLVERVVTVGDEEHGAANPTAATAFYRHHQHPYGGREPSTVVSAQIVEAWRAAGNNNTTYSAIGSPLHPYFMNEHSNSSYSAYGYHDSSMSSYPQFTTVYHHQLHPYPPPSSSSPASYYYATFHHANPPIAASVYSASATGTQGGEELNNGNNNTSNLHHLHQHNLEAASFVGQTKSRNRKKIANAEYVENDTTNQINNNDNNNNKSSRTVEKTKTATVSSTKQSSRARNRRDNHDRKYLSDKCEKATTPEKLFFRRTDRKKTATTVLLIPNDDEEKNHRKERERIQTFQKNALMKLAEWILDPDQLDELQQILVVQTPESSNLSK